MAEPPAYSKVSSAPADDSDTYPTSPQYQAGQKPPLNPRGEYGYYPTPPECSFNAQPYAPPPYTPYPQAPVQPQERPEQMQTIQYRSKGCCWEPSSCCCLSLSTGSYVVASTIIGLGIMICLMLVINLKDLHDSIYQTGLTTNFTYEVTIGIVISTVLFTLLLMIFSGILMKGIKENKPRLMVPYMMWMWLAILITIAYGLGLMVLFGYMGEFEAICMVALIFGVITLLETYFLLVIRALYFQLKLTEAHNGSLMVMRAP